MRKFIYSFFAFCTIFFTASCSSGEYDKAIKDACEQVNCTAHNIVFVDSIDNNSTKEQVLQYIASIDSAVVAIGDSALVEFLCPEASTTKQNLEKIRDLGDYAYLRFKVDATSNGRILTKYALVSYREDLMRPIKIVDEDYQSDMEFQLKDSEFSIKSTIEDLKNLQSKTPEELLQMKVEKEQRIEEQRKADEERWEAQKKAEEERRNAPSSWEGVAQWMKKKGCSVVGIFKSNGGYGGALTIYKRGGGTYIASCSLSATPVDFQFADNLRKVSGSTYQHNEPGSDMPERYTISGGELITYCYNPDMGEWVNMGSYYQVYL